MVHRVQTVVFTYALAAENSTFQIEYQLNGIREVDVEWKPGRFLLATQSKSTDRGQLTSNEFTELNFFFVPNILMFWY